MKIHEFQAKELLKRYSIPIQMDSLLKKDQAEIVLDKVHNDLGANQFVIGGADPAGGRGKVVELSFVLIEKQLWKKLMIYTGGH